MRESFSIKFYLNASKASEGKNQIYARLIVDREKVELATKLQVKPSEWNENSGRVSKSSFINDELADIEAQLRKIKRQILDNEEPLTAKAIKLLFKGDKKFRIGILGYLREHIEELAELSLNEKISPGTVKGYRTTLSHLTQFLRASKKNGLPISEVNYKFITDFDFYLKTKYKDKQGNSICTNHANKQHSRLRTLLHKAMRMGIVVSNPYALFKLKGEKSNRQFLDETQLEKLKNNELQKNASLLKVRDYFLFSCYTGLRFDDASKLTMSKIILESDGTMAIQTITQKTNEEVYVPLLEPAKRIIEKYSNDESRKVLGRVLPDYSNQKINSYLKVIADLCGIEKSLSHHVARHTCATLLLNNGMPIEVVQRILGHKDIRTTKIYAKMLNSTVKREMKKIANIIKS